MILNAAFLEACRTGVLILLKEEGLLTEKQFACLTQDRRNRDHE